MPVMRPAPDTVARVGKLVTSEPTEWRRASGGYTVAKRWVVQLRDGSSVFVKQATDENTTSWLRAEHRAYASLKKDFVPKLVAWDDGVDPILILEDLSSGIWPPPWSETRIEAVVRLLERIAGTVAPKHFRSLSDDQAALRGWQSVAADPSGFLGLGLVSDTWLANALPAFMRAEASTDLTGDALVHGDVRSDNICFHDGRTLLVDWNGAVRGNPKFDLIVWLPGLHVEGGPPPWTFTVAEPELIAAFAGYLASRAWRPPPQQGPAIRQLQLAQLRVALPWAARALGLTVSP